MLVELKLRTKFARIEEHLSLENPQQFIFNWNFLEAVYDLQIVNGIKLELLQT